MKTCSRFQTDLDHDTQGLVAALETILMSHENVQDQLKQSSLKICLLNYIIVICVDIIVICLNEKVASQQGKGGKGCCWWQQQG